MSKHGTKIEWTHFPGYKGETWNPITGCSHAGSPGCDNCYAERISKRFKWPWGNPILHPERLDQPFHWKKPRSIFVCSMSDLFHKGVPDEFIMRVFNAMHPDILSPSQHIYLILTKRAQRMREFFEKYTSNGTKPWDNVWLGVTVENNDYRSRIDDLLQTPCAHRFVSVEPMLGEVILTDEWDSYLEGYAMEMKCYGGSPIETRIDAPALDWVICGGESGPGARPVHPDWVRSLRDQCQEAGTPFFFKQWGEWYPLHQLLCAAPGIRGKQWYTFDPDTSVCRIGKKGAGRHLDGRYWNEFPEVSK